MDMRFAIAYSKLDSAGVNIIRHLKKSFLPQIPILDFNCELIYAYGLNSKKNPFLRNVDFLVFASKHKSAKGEASLTVHAPGNWKNADYGGLSMKACPTSAFVIKYLFKELNKNAEVLKGKYNVTLEVTHHGPLTEIPCCFIEIGSSEKEWNDEEAGRVIADSILSLQNFDKNDFNWIPVVGIGGPHYAPNFNKVQLDSDYAVGHIISEYSLPLTESILKEAEEKTEEIIKEVLIDWKGCGNSESRERVLNIVKNSGLKSKRTKNVEK